MNGQNRFQGKNGVSGVMPVVVTGTQAQEPPREQTILRFVGGHGGVYLAGRLSKQGFLLLESLAVAVPDFQIWGVGAGELRREGPRPLREFAFGVGKRVIDPRAQVIAGRQYGTSGSLPLVGGIGSLRLPLPYDDQDRMAWERDIGGDCLELLRELKLVAPWLQIPVRGKTRRYDTRLGRMVEVESEVPQALGLIELALAPGWETAIAPLSSAARDAWMAPHLERQRERALRPPAAPPSGTAKAKRSRRSGAPAAGDVGPTTDG